MYGWDPDEEQTGETDRRMPPRRHHARDAYDDGRDLGRREAYDGRDFGGREAYDEQRELGRREAYGDGRDFGGREAYGDERYIDRPAYVPEARMAMSRRRRPAGGRLRSAGRRVGSVLGWVGLLVFAPLIVGVIAGAIGQHIGL